jgi:hypothetical protein
MDSVNGRTAIGHLRSGSTDSVSTLATFATATEGLGSENGDDEDHDNYAVQRVVAPPVVRSSIPLTAKRGTFGLLAKNILSEDRHPSPEETSRPSSVIHDRDAGNLHRPSISSFESTGTTRSFPLVNKPKSQLSITPIGTPDPESREPDGSILSDDMTLTEKQSINSEDRQPSPVHMLAKDDQFLVEKLVASLGKCVLGLQEAGRGGYEGRVWRRRLDAARRVLEGEEGAI